MKRIELLSPAKNIEVAIAAIDSGADAVYIGASRFGARAAAGNELRDIEALTKYAHRLNAKVYVTLNTLLYEDELSQAEELIRHIYECGADALIVQDMGILEMNLPPLPLIASTQAHNHTPERVKFLEDVGFKRAILARELTIEQIAAIREATQIELECFAHGALCVSYSGRCYLSLGAYGRSGNRGECAQPCRMTYHLQNADGKRAVSDRHLLSIKDLNVSDYLSELLDAGITSFKIEGRLKDIDYVKNVVAYYRQKLDAVMSGKDMRAASSGKTVIDFSPDPSKSFSRGWTSYFITGERDNITSFFTQKSLGEKIGTVESVGQECFVLSGEKTLNNGDGICFFDDKGVLSGMNVMRAVGSHVYPKDIRWITPGMTIYRNYDIDFDRALKASKTERRIGATLTMTETDRGFRLTAVDEDGNETICEFDDAKALADKPEAALETIRKQLSKLGETIFYLTELRIELQKSYFLPVGRLNDIRRTTFESLLAQREKNYRRKEEQIAPNDVAFPEKTLDESANVTNSLARQFYQRHGVGKIDPALELTEDFRDKKLMTLKHCLKYECGKCAKHPKTTELDIRDKDWIEPMYLDDGVRLFRLHFNCKDCVMEVYLHTTKRNER